MRLELVPRVLGRAPVSAAGALVAPAAAVEDEDDDAPVAEAVDVSDMEGDHLEGVGVGVGGEVVVGVGARGQAVPVEVCTEVEGVTWGRAGMTYLLACGRSLHPSSALLLL